MNEIEQLIDIYFPIPKPHLKRKYIHKKDKIQPEHSTWEMLPDFKFKPKYSKKKKLLVKYYKIIRMALVYNKNIFFAEELVGCSITELKQHIEKLWLPWMNWNNYGRNGWVIDHIYPCHTFDIFNQTELKICFYYKNLQPLSFKDNFNKLHKILPKYKNHQLV